MSWAYTRSQRMRPFTWAREITTATSPLWVSKATPRIMVPPYRLNPDADLNQGLVAKYISLPGMTGGKYWYDLCGKNNGTLTNMTSGYGWQGPQDRPGGWGAMRFAAVRTNFVDCGSASAFGLTTYTMSAWYKTTIASSYQNIMGKGLSYFMGIYAGRIFVQNNSTYITNGALTDTNWHHIVATYDGTTMRLYYDGKFDQQAASSAPAATVTSFAIGQSAGVYFDGYIDDASLYNRALSAGEAVGLYEASKNQYRDEILCAYEV